MANMKQLILKGLVVVFAVFWFGLTVVSASEWRVIDRDGLTLHHQLSDSESTKRFLDELVLQREVVRKKLGHIPPIPITVYLTPSQSDFDALTQGRLPHWSAAVAMPVSRTIVLKVGNFERRTQIIQHELSHVLLHGAVGRVPVWFNEGVAMWVSHEWRLQHTASVLYAILSGGLIPLSDIDSVLQFSSVKADLAYTESLLAVLYIIRLGGENAIVAMISELSHGAPFDVALFRVTEKTPYEFEGAWQDYVSGRFSVTALLVSPDSLWGYLVLLFLMASVAVRLRNRAKLRRWEAEERFEEMQLKVYRAEDET
jgi:hypothetical protein